MNIITRELKSGYTIIVTYDQGGPLSLRLENKDKEFVGQLFVSMETINESMTRMTNGDYTITADDIDLIRKKINETESKPAPKQKSESATAKVLSKFNVKSESEFNFDELNKFCSKYESAVDNETPDSGKSALDVQLEPGMILSDELGNVEVVVRVSETEDPETLDKVFTEPMRSMDDIRNLTSDDMDELYKESIEARPLVITYLAGLTVVGKVLIAPEIE